MNRAIAITVAAVVAVIGTYGALVYADKGYFTREAVVMLGILIVAGFAFVLGFCCLLVRRTGARPAKQHHAEIVLIPKRHE